MTGSGGIGAAVYALRRARSEADDVLTAALEECRLEHERDARALHHWRLSHPDETDPGVEA